MTQIGLEKPEVLPLLVSFLKAGGLLSVYLVGVLGEIGQERPELGELLVPLLGDTDQTLVDMVAGLVGDIGCVAALLQEAVDRLLARYERAKEDGSGRVTAAYTLS